MSVIINSLKTAIATYCVIPIRKVDWDSSKTKYSIGLFPIVGVLIGLLIYGWNELALLVGVSSYVYAAVFIMITILFTGGIHIDGYMDTVDAISSHQPREKKLEIMKDSHTGAFACIYMVLYYILMFAFLVSIYDGGRGCMCRCFSYMNVLTAIFVISRVLSAFLVLYTPNARRAGMLDYMTKFSVDKKNVIINTFITLLFFIGAIVYMVLLFDVLLLIICGVAIIWALIYRIYMMHSLNGVTGDTSGFFLAISELLMIASVYFLRML